MRKLFGLFLSAAIILILMKPALAVPDLTIEATEKNNIVIAELETPAVYELKITNNGAAEYFKIYTLVGIKLEPGNEFELPHGETVMEINAFPGEWVLENKQGFVSFEYQIFGRNSGILKGTLTMKIVKLEDLFAVNVEPLNPDDSEAEVVIRNRENLELDNVTFVLDSVFFSGREVLSFGKYEEVKIPVKINKEGIEKISAGPYMASVKIIIDGKETNQKAIVDFLEKEGISVSEVSKGFVIKKTVFTKTNKGNTLVTARIEAKKDIVSRLFTTISLAPLSVERKGAYVTYTWEKTLGPSESLVVETTTNYTFPFVLIALVVVIGIMVWRYSQRAVLLSKKVSFVRTKGGELALKVKLHVKARKNVDNVQIIDQVPSMTKLFEHFGKKPDKVDKVSRRLFWNIRSLTKGESIVYSYIIYSKLNVVGRFELPIARAIFEIDGKAKEVTSNRAFFAAEKD